MARVILTAEEKGENRHDLPALIQMEPDNRFVQRHVAQTGAKGVSLGATIWVFTQRQRACRDVSDTGRGAVISPVCRLSQRPVGGEKMVKDQTQVAFCIRRNLNRPSQGRAVSGPASRLFGA